MNFRVPARFLLIVAALSVGGCMSSRLPAPEADANAAWHDTRAGYLAASRAEHNHRIETWRTVRAWTFDDGSMPDEFRIFEGKWEVDGGRLVASGGEAERNRIIGIGEAAWPSFRLEFDVTLSPRPGAPANRIGDIGIRLGADPETASFADRYVVILAQYANQAAVIYRLNVPFARTEFPAIRAGAQHHVAVEFVKPHIRVWVDDRVVLEAWERSGRSNRDHSDFLDLDPASILALHTWDTDMAVDNLRISVPEAKK